MRDAVITARLTAGERDGLVRRAARAGKKLSEFVREQLTASSPVPTPAVFPAATTGSAPVAWLMWETGQVGGALTLRSTSP